jgi:two-component system CheB/CheR fusion protein
MAFVLVQHLDPGHESALAQILSRATPLPVLEITDDQAVRPDHVYVIPPNMDLRIEQGVLRLSTRKTGRTPHRPIDRFFESLAGDQGGRAVGVVLSGTANDGTVGLEAIKAEGGITFAQDDSAKYDSMPHSAVAAGCVDLVLPPGGIAAELARIAKHPFVAGQLWTRGEDDHAEAVLHQDDGTALPSGGKGTPRTGARQAHAEADRLDRDADGVGDGVADGVGDGYRKVMMLLRNHCGVDFSLYKSTTIRRRIARRMVLTKQNSLEDYARSLRDHGQELDSLFSDVLISVTSFFRNPETFEALQTEVLPRLLAQRGDDPIRCWVLGCSTGQEAYSLAISFVEVAEMSPTTRRLQVFATDLNEKLLEKARQGLYSKSLAQDISPERLQRHFVEEQGGYRVSKSLREMVVFARQNLIADPPFSRMDLISCRNLLIYLEPSAQRRALPEFHYSLKPGGFLVLGTSESIGEFTDLFEPLDRKHKIFTKKPGPTPPFHLFRERGEDGARSKASAVHLRQIAEAQPPEGFTGELNAQREADRIAVSQFAPPAVLINDALQILQFRGPTGAFLEPPAGKASFDVLKMAREGLMLPLRAAIHKARKENKTARAANVRVKRNGEESTVQLEVIPLKNLRERCFLVVFQDGTEAAAQPPPDKRPSGRDPDSQRVAQLEAELLETREYLRFVQEQHETVNEELQAANEEVQSANEELQSINEELETSKEELESANEELITVNEEMSHRNTELTRLNNDLGNLQASAKVAMVLLGRDLSIRRFSPQAEKQFALVASHVGRPIGHVRHHLVAGPDAGGAAIDLEALSAETIAGVREQEFEVKDQAGHWHSLRVRPYMTTDNKVDGAVMVLVDIDMLKRSEQAIKQKEEQLRQTHAELQAHADELARFNDVAVGRELRMIELKKEINALCAQQGEAARYPLAFETEG